MPLLGRKTCLGKVRMKNGAYSCLICGKLEKKLMHFQGKFEGLRVLKHEILEWMRGINFWWKNHLEMGVLLVLRILHCLFEWVKLIVRVFCDD